MTVTTYIHASSDPSIDIRADRTMTKDDITLDFGMDVTVFVTDYQAREVIAVLTKVLDA